MAETEIAYETDMPVIYEVAGAVAVLRLNRPRYHNAQNGQLIYALDAAFRRAADDDAVGAIVLAANGRNFSAGHDIGTPGRDVQRSFADRRSFWPDHLGQEGAASAYVREQELYLGMCRRWRDLPKPTVAAVQGACIAGGLMLAWVCDLIVAADDAFFADPVLAMGVPGVEYFAHAFEMHPRIAREFLFLGERMPAQRAYALGMVNRVVPLAELDETVMGIAARLAGLPRFGVMMAKQAFNHAENAMGKQATLDAVFNMHHLTHAHNQMVTGSAIGGVTPGQIAARDK